MRAMTIALFAGVSGVLSTAGAPQPLSMRCTVHAVRQPGAQPRTFTPQATAQALPDGLTANASTTAVPGGERTDAVVQDTTGTERELALTFQLTIPGAWTHAFLTDGAGPRPLKASGAARYRAPCSLPAVTFYGPKGGVTVAAPFEVDAPSLAFTWKQQDQKLNVVVAVSNLRLPARGEAKAGCLVGLHASCWRPGLGWLVGLYPEYFTPPNPRVFKYDGPMIYDFIEPQKRLQRDCEQDLAWQELGWYWPHLGLYLPAGETWQRQPRSEGGKGNGGTVTRSMIRDYLELSERLGVAQCLYFQSTESWIEFAEDHFPDSPFRRANGDVAPTWVKCMLMNPDPDGGFGRHILQQVRDLIGAFPKMAGVFWDQNCYTGVDYAHDDGVSMVDGRRVSMMEFAQKRMLEQASRILHEHDKVIFTNGGWTAGLARYCDGHMSEGTVPTRRLQYICMMKHLTLLSYDRNLQASREKLALALETGAQPCVTLGDDACRDLFRRYQPIFRLLQGRQWVFHPRALTLPSGSVGNIFRNPAGNHVVTTVAPPVDAITPAERAAPLDLDVRLPETAGIRHIFGLSPRRRGLQAVNNKQVPSGFEISIPRPEAGAAVLLAQNGRWIGSGTPQRIAGRETPVDILFANLQTTPWNGEWRLEIQGQNQVEKFEIAPGQTQRVRLGPILVANDATELTVTIHGPAPENGGPRTVIDIPVVQGVELYVPTTDTAQLRRDAAVHVAVANRLPQTVRVAISRDWGEGSGAQPVETVTLNPDDVRPISVAVDAESLGLKTLKLLARWPGGSSSASCQIDVFDATIPSDFQIKDVTELVLQMDLFNSLGGKWEDKPVTINGVDAGRLPITGKTLRWHEAVKLTIADATAREILKHGVLDNGEIVLKAEGGNTVRNCFKTRNMQASIRVRSGAQYRSTWARAVQCSAGNWLYAEGNSVGLGQPVPLGTLRFIRTEWQTGE
jgi:hypothetical protein